MSDSSDVALVIKSREQAIRVHRFLTGPEGKKLRLCNVEDYEQIAFALHCWRLQHNQKYRIKHYSIVDKKTGDIVPLRFNVGQEKLWYAIESQKKAGLPVRIILLKFRQFGGSTLTAAWMFDETVFGEAAQNCRTLILSYEVENSIHLFSMQETIYDNPPEGLVFPERKKTAERHWIFDELQSHIQVATAGGGIRSKRKGRGHTRRFVHVSEVAYYDKAESSMLGVVNSVPADAPNTGIVLESTANGTGDYFERQWKQAAAKKSAYIAVFVGWHELPIENSRAFVDSDEKEQFKRSLKPEEQDLQRLYTLSLEQLNWRRFTISDRCDGDSRLFQQEYPICAEEAFLTSGNKRFNVYVIDNWKRERERANYQYPPERYDITVDGEFVRSDRGDLFVYEQPEKYHHGTPPREYIIGSDVSEGLEISEDGRERDDSVIQVLKRGNMASDDPESYKSLTQVAVWRGKIEPYNLAEKIYHVGLWYNRALAAIEANGSGSSVNYILHHIREYPFVYTRNITDRTTQRSTKTLGYMTTIITKRQAIDALAAMIEHEEIEVRDSITVDQLATYMEKKGKLAAQIGCKDDDVMALAIAVAANLEHSHFKQPKDSITRDDSFNAHLTDIRKQLGWPGGKPKNPNRNQKMDKIDKTYTPTFG